MQEKEDQCKIMQELHQEIQLISFIHIMQHYAIP